MNSILVLELRWLYSFSERKADQTREAETKEKEAWRLYDQKHEQKSENQKLTIIYIAQDSIQLPSTGGGKASHDEAM